MINILADYFWRSVMSFGDEEMPIDRSLYVFQTNPKLEQKVKGDALLPYYGNTVVFQLDEAVRETLKTCQRTLYEKAGWMLAEPLDPDTFHMTLHDLVSGPEKTEALQQQMAEAAEKAKVLIRQWKEEPPISMFATWVFNMVDTSIVLGFCPTNMEDYKRLDAMYMALEEVIPLNRALTPHVTLAYYRPGSYSIYDVKCLNKVLTPVSLHFQLKMEDLVLQTFESMNCYHTVED